jgi:hypothetical protein
MIRRAEPMRRSRWLILALLTATAMLVGPSIQETTSASASDHHLVAAVYTYDLAASPVVADTAPEPGVTPFGTGKERASSGKPTGTALDPASGVAAKGADAAATTAGKELTTYYPPNRGFLGHPSKQTLEAGTRIDRYGREGGTFVSPEGSPLEMRALPPGAGDRPYNVYEVVNPVKVDAGTVAPWFGQLGLGTQYELPASVAELIEQGVLKAVG